MQRYRDSTSFVLKHGIQVIIDPSHQTCPLVFAIDPYGKECPFHCTYCYANDTATPSLTDEMLRDLESLLKEANQGAVKSPLHRILKNRLPIRIGFLRDPFPDEERAQAVTRKLLELFDRYRYPCIVFTKSDRVAEDVYANLLSGDHACVQISMTSLDEGVSAFLEPKAPSTRARLDALERLGERRVRAIARINPLIRRITIKGSPVPCFSLELLDEIKSTGASGVIFGALNLRPRRPDRFAELVPREDPREYDAFLRSIVQHCERIGLSYSRCQLGPRLNGFPQVPEQRSGSCCQVNEALVPFGVDIGSRLSCANLNALERPTLFLAHLMVKKLNAPT